MHAGNKLVPFELLKSRGTLHTTLQGSEPNPVKPGDPSLPEAERRLFPDPPEGLFGPEGLWAWEHVRTEMQHTGVILKSHMMVLIGFCHLAEKILTDRKSMTAAELTQLRMYAAELALSPTSLERYRRPSHD